MMCVYCLDDVEDMSLHRCKGAISIREKFDNINAALDHLHKRLLPIESSLSSIHQLKFIKHELAKTLNENRELECKCNGQSHELKKLKAENENLINIINKIRSEVNQCVNYPNLSNSLKCYE